tara:strand:+ start:35 stop:238 length:204 start_codon:yes stop_codon:yes gene_type:complete
MKYSGPYLQVVAVVVENAQSAFTSGSEILKNKKIEQGGEIRLGPDTNEQVSAHIWPALGRARLCARK